MIYLGSACMSQALSFLLCVFARRCLVSNPIRTIYSTSVVTITVSHQAITKVMAIRFKRKYSEYHDNTVVFTLFIKDGLSLSCCLWCCIKRIKPHSNEKGFYYEWMCIISLKGKGLCRIEMISLPLFEWKAKEIFIIFCDWC